MFRRLLLAFVLLLPLIEIAGFVVVGRWIGVLPTLGLVIATTIAGSILLRLQGFGVLSRIRGDLEAGRDPSREVAHGLMILFAGVLLLIPGFVTDLVGLLLFLPPVREAAWRLIRSHVVIASVLRPMSDAGRSGAAARGTVIDLDAADYSTEPKSPWKRVRRD